jgi:endonuclease/exonuclease/phosphatase family metal-dependent hydrolase
MPVRIATFNANNLFSRWSFSGELPPGSIDPILAGTGGSSASGDAPEVVDVNVGGGVTLTGVLRTFRGRLVQGKDPKARAWIARRIAAVDADVLCLQEVEDQHALEVFCRDDLRPLGIDYPYRVVVEGNDPRRIDVAVCSRLPITRVSSWRFWPSPEGGRVFGRDLVQAEIAAPDRKPLHVFVNHLKSNFVTDEFRLTEEEIAAERESIARRRRDQAVAVTAILKRQRLGRRVVVTGDMNDEPDADTLSPLAEAGLVEQINTGKTVAGPNRKGVLVEDKFAALASNLWTHRHRAKGTTHFGLYDHIWTSGDLRVADARVMRRTQIGGDGSDHDPAYVDLEL